MDGLRDNGVVQRTDIRFNGVAVLWRCCNNTHIPDTHQRHVERPGYGRGRKGQDVHATTELLQPFLVGHTEALLFVNNEKP